MVRASLEVAWALAGLNLVGGCFAVVVDLGGDWEDFLLDCWEEAVGDDWVMWRRSPPM